MRKKFFFLSFAQEITLKFWNLGGGKKYFSNKKYNVLLNWLFSLRRKNIVLKTKICYKTVMAYIDLTNSKQAKQGQESTKQVLVFSKFWWVMLWESK